MLRSFDAMLLPLSKAPALRSVHMQTLSLQFIMMMVFINKDPFLCLLILSLSLYPYIKTTVYVLHDCFCLNKNENES
jgi:hypothetical protein